MEVYLDYLLVKIKGLKQYIVDLLEAFVVLRRYKMKLNSLKCAFRVESGRFLGLMISEWGIEAKRKRS